ncbi:MAG: MBL fold metallo-hydrolase [Ignavibacteria bacterium]
MKLKFFGTRGSIPTPGKATVRYGGNTPCVEVRLRDNNLIVFDAGTGIRELGEELIAKGESVNAYVLIGHPHWDHIQGFPFFKPAFISGNELTIIGAQSRFVTLRQMIADQMNKVYFPIQLNELKAKINFHPVREGTIPIYDGELSTIYVNHPAFALGFRLEAAGRSLVYISDNEPFDREVARSLKNVEKVITDKYAESKGDPNQRIFDFARGADILIHDATYTPEEYVNRVGWGHSHYLFTLKVAAEAQVKKLILFHHDPSHSDEKIDEIVETCKKEVRTRGYRFECFAAAEGMELTW